jgi:hypothetical protein
MAETERSRRAYLKLAAYDPAGGTATQVLLSYDRLQAVARRSLGHAKECGNIVPNVLQKPTAIFEGLREEIDEDRRGVGWRCYCGVPERAYYADGTERLPYPHQVYLVVVNEEHVAYNWRWEKTNPDAPRLPQNHQSRFKTRLL